MISNSAEPGLSPASKERSRKIVCAMRALLIEKGYAATSLDDVIARVGGSRRAIYDAFDGKAGLFRAVLQEVVSEVSAPGAPPWDKTVQPRTWLIETGTEFTMGMLRPEVIAIFGEMIATRGLDHAEMEELWKAGPGRFRRRLADWLREQDSLGRLTVSDPEAVARVLPEMMCGAPRLELLMRRRDKMDREEVKAHVASAVDLVLNGLKPR
ncbi:MAG: TetR/AcrR family transcriptional regulator [Pseudomonadota bacterium]